MNLNKIIIWGHELHEHTHSYIHNAFYRTFKYMKYDTYWFNKDGINNFTKKVMDINFENSLFILHGMESYKIPINDSSIYISHNAEWVSNGNKKIIKNHINEKKNIGILSRNILLLQVYNIDCSNELKFKNCDYYRFNINNNIIFMPWATDLLPEEIDENILKLDSIKTKKVSNFIGMPVNYNEILKQELEKFDIKYVGHNFIFDNKNQGISIDDNQKLIQESIIAPAIQTEWQVEHHYIPCRIFKNISYGKIGLTNNPIVNKLFDNTLIYSSEISEIVKKGLFFELNPNKKNILKEQMQEVRDNHTYINRINFILEYLNQFMNVKIKKLI